VERLRVFQRTITDVWLGTGPAQRELARAFVAEGTIAALEGEADQAIHGGLMQLVGGIVAEGQASGELDGRIEPALAAWLVVTALSGATVAWIAEGGRRDLERTTGDTLDVILGGLACGRRTRGGV
jgi:hypothetical protein